MRHFLVPVLSEDYWNDKISSIEVGSEVKVAVYWDGPFCGPSKVLEGSVDHLDSWDNEISSLIVFPKAQVDPLGVILNSEEFHGVYGYVSGGPRVQFFPLPMYFADAVARYPVFGDYMNDEAKEVVIQGNNIQAELFEHANFDGHRLLLPSTGCFPNAIYRWKGYLVYMLSWCKMGYGGEDFNGEVSSLIVSWTGPTDKTRPLPPPPRGLPTIGPGPTRHRAPPAS
jgi:hypothetical protein